MRASHTPQSQIEGGLRDLHAATLLSLSGSPLKDVWWQLRLPGCWQVGCWLEKVKKTHGINLSNIENRERFGHAVTCSMHGVINHCVSLFLRINLIASS